MAKKLEGYSGIIVSVDFPCTKRSGLGKLKEVVGNTHFLDEVAAYKFGIGQVTNLDECCELVRSYDDGIPIIYDHQKAANDAPHIGRLFAEVFSEADYVILVPGFDPDLLMDWMDAARDQGLGIIVGSRPSFTDNISDGAIKSVYTQAANFGVYDFLVPGNLPGISRGIKEYLEEIGVEKPRFFAPGIGAQGGDIPAMLGAVGPFFAIVGRGIYNAEDVTQAAQEFGRQIYERP
jgi:orotidine-5'-phosphate decarboxylase